jgi:hypothetical protein
MSARLQIDVVNDDVLTFPADVLALKYAQGLHGADLTVAEVLGLDESVLGSKLSRPGSYHLAEGRNLLGASKVLFIGVVSLWGFRYGQIRAWASRVLEALKASVPHARHVAVTLHGVNYGLDETEAFSAELGGFLEARAQGHCPDNLDRITFVEFNARRASRLQTALLHLMPQPVVERLPAVVTQVQESRPIATAGRDSERKPHVFVAMPFTDEFEDVYYYGIEPAVRAAGFLCERADTRSFSGDILDWIKVRIQSAELVVADLTTANANVYLEVGYAWGQRRPTILLTRDVNDLKFDVRGQRCVVYARIRDLEDKLKRELAEVKASG